MALVNVTPDPTCLRIANEIWEHLSQSIVAVDKHLRYYSYTTIIEEDTIRKADKEYTVQEFVEQEILPNLGMDINMTYYMGNFVCKDDGQKVISISWWLEDYYVWWYIVINS